jgi:hypothetical protein
VSLAAKKLAKALMMVDREKEKQQTANLSTQNKLRFKLWRTVQTTEKMHSKAQGNHRTYKRN